MKNNTILLLVGRLKPGECLTVDSRELEYQVRGFEHNGTWFTPADRVLPGTVTIQAKAARPIFGPCRTTTWLE